MVDVEPLFGEMACMRNVEREQYANLEIAKMFFPKNSEIFKLLSVIQRMIQIRGLALFPRTEITDLSAKAQTSKFRQMRDIGEIPEDLQSWINDILSGKGDVDDAEHLLYSEDE